MEFTQLHVLGNDTIIIKDLEESIKDPSDLARRICRRNFGVGADSMILALPSKKADFSMRLFNSDGSEAEFGGNEIMSFSKYLYDSKLAGKKQKIETLAGVITTEIIDGNVKIAVGKPSFERKSIPMDGKGNTVGIPLKIGNKKEIVTALSVGNPHAVVFVNTFDFDLEKRGRNLETHEIFPNRVNVQFVEIINENEIAAQQWERGAGITLATGTGAAAALAAGVVSGKCKKKVIVHFIGGDMAAEWGKGDILYVTGKPVLVCQGILNQKL